MEKIFEQIRKGTWSKGIFLRHSEALWHLSANKADDLRFVVGWQLLHHKKIGLGLFSIESILFEIMLVYKPTCFPSSNTQVFAALWLTLLAFLPQPSSVGLSGSPTSAQLLWLSSTNLVNRKLKKRETNEPECKSRSVNFSRVLLLSRKTKLRHILEDPTMQKGQPYVQTTGFQDNDAISRNDVFCRRQEEEASYQF